MYYFYNGVKLIIIGYYLSSSAQVPYFPTASFLRGAKDFQ